MGKIARESTFTSTLTKVPQKKKKKKKHLDVNKRYMPTIKKIVTKALPLSVPNRLV